MVEKLNSFLCLVKFCRLEIIAHASDPDGGRLAFADLLVWLVNSGQMREHYCIPGGAVTMDKHCSS